MNTCYICQEVKQTELYYLLNDLSYINPKKTNNIPENAKSICKECLPEFIIKRQLNFSCCVICKAYNNYPGAPARICNNKTEVHSNAVDGNYYVGPCTLPLEAKDNDLICKMCFENLKKKPTTKELLQDFNFSHCCLCKKDFKQNEDNWGENGRIINDKMFKIGFDNIYKITDNKVLKERGIFCSSCLMTLNYKQYFGSKCSVCKKKYACDEYGYSKEPCKWIIFDKVISKHDINHFENSNYFRKENEILEFVNERPKNFKFKKLICNFCVDKLIEEKIVQLK